ncbi:glycosyltransferase involved in cell wall biosynthesis [Couchioplanes caeruleus]|uniref:Glycosyl transferase n=2 Tax=Couchioplanes caeruleus TaxID=56438 RepID=A0A1K0FP95_9ACTN|nr:glycosyl transferase [Couchioplanes caeruleus subsp. caeruleus]ROP33130.1 glycosyltransferase involved in cell wall biosynthesis [Couchioplanes caeruleus]
MSPSSRRPTPPTGAPSPTVTVVIPALNEEDNLPLVLENLPPVDQVVVVDGRSDDDTVAVAREVRPDVVVVRQTRSGKGNALACGFAAATGDIVVTVNADGSADPGEILRFVDALLSGAEAAHGSRFRYGGEHRDARPVERLGHAVLSRIVNLLFGTRYTDLSCGYNAYWRELLPVLDLPGPDVPGLRRGRRAWGDGPEIETLITIRMATRGLRVVEVATVGYPRIYGDRQRRLLPVAVRMVRTVAIEYARRRRRVRIHPAGRPSPGATAGATPAPEAVAPDQQAGRHGARHSVPVPPRPRRRSAPRIVRGERRDNL